PQPVRGGRPWFNVSLPSIGGSQESTAAQHPLWPLAPRALRATRASSPQEPAGGGLRPLRVEGRQAPSGLLRVCGSASHIHRGKKLRIRLTQNQVEIFLNGERLALHPRDRSRDDVGMRKLTATEAQDLCEMLEERSLGKSIVFTTQLPLDHWAEVIADPAIADAIRDCRPHDHHQPAPVTAASKPKNLQPPAQTVNHRRLRLRRHPILKWAQSAKSAGRNL